MPRGAAAIATATGPRDDLQSRRNRAELQVREALAGVEDVYVDRSSWHVNGRGPEAFVAVIARTSRARDEARQALEAIAGLSDQEWSEGWIGLDLGDWMIRVFPERAP